LRQSRFASCNGAPHHPRVFVQFAPARRLLRTPPMWSKSQKRTYTIGAVIAVVTVCGIWAPWKRNADEEAAASSNAETAAPADDGAIVTLSPNALKENPLGVTRVARRPLARDLSLVGSVAYDADHFAVVGPLIAGRITALRAGTGDRVRRGQALAELESADIGAAQAAYLEAKSKLAAAQSNARREHDLAMQHVSSARESELAEAQASSEQAALDAARQRLESLGFSKSDLEKLAASTGGRVAIRSPIDGVVIAREVTLGQAVQAATTAFKVADLSHLWVNLDIYEKDLEAVHVGQEVDVRTESLPGRVFAARVAYVEPHVDDKTRTARVRIEIENPKGALRPGQFVTAALHGDPSRVTTPVLAVPRKAILSVDDKRVVFVQLAADRFARRAVEIGSSGGDFVEVTHGLHENDVVVTDNAFLLKSELLR
jgi:cobalt-zinc-cadmium efflux system membrane fusion protein